MARFVVLGLAVAFVISVAAPQLGARLRSALGIDAPHPAGMPTSPTPPVTPAPAPTLPARADLERPSAAPTASYAPAVARAAPAVVSITARRLVTTRQVLTPPPLMRQMFPGLIVGQSQQLQSSLGSGVIASADGYVLTNNHVIQGAEEIEAILSDGRAAKATIVGGDPETDIAVLKIDAENLPTIAIADGHSVNVGDVVLAIGNPFGLGNTVTMGIVSALGRLLLHKSAYEDFIQTDAAINQGNSGGALVNADGELVGINSDVLSPSGGSVGIGFAIPVATAKTVLEQIIAHGKVIRGWIGAEYADLPVKSGDAPRGVLVRGVYDKGPAAAAGLRGGDVLLKLNDDAITSQFELRNREANLAPGTRVRLSGLREGKPFALELTLQERPPLRPPAS